MSNHNKIFPFKTFISFLKSYKKIEKRQVVSSLASSDVVNKKTEKVVAMGNFQGNITLISTDENTKICELSGHQSGITCLKFS